MFYIKSRGRKINLRNDNVFTRCPVCGREIKQQTVDEIVDKVLELPERTKFQVLAPVVRGRKGEHQKEFEAARKSGFSRVRADGIAYDLNEKITLEKNKKHSIEIVVDRLVMKDGIKSRLTESIETAGTLTGGLVYIDVIDGEVGREFSDEIGLNLFKF